jgi:hypothetical protein
MFNKPIILLIGLLVILSVLFERFTKVPLLNERFSNTENTGNTTTNVDPEPKYNSDKTSYVDYSADYSNFTLKLTNGFFKLKNSDDAFISYNGNITIQFTQNDYRDTPFDTQDNIINCFRKWQYFKYNDDIYRMIIPEVVVSGTDSSGTCKANRSIIDTGYCATFTTPDTCKGKLDSEYVFKGGGNQCIWDSTNGNGTASSGTCKANRFPNVDAGYCATFATPDTCKGKLDSEYIIKGGGNQCIWSEGFQNKNNDKIIENFENNIIKLTFEFQSVVENQAIDFKEELVLSELRFYTGSHGNTNTFTGDSAADYASGLLGNLGEINNGVACGWHYDEDTGGAAGYFSEILNDKEWQKDNPELYNSLSKYICPSYLPVCTGQRSSGIVAGKCITLKDDCNNGVVDNMMGLPKRTYNTTTLVDPYEIKYTNVISKNIANKEALKSTINKLTHVLDEPTIETFENTGDSETACKFNIENKCYDQYLVVDKNYYNTGANIFNNIFPSTDPNIFKQTCYDVTHWISKNIVSLLFYKLIVGGGAGLLYWSLNPHLDYQIRIFKSFIAFVFCEIYILYNVYKHVLKPAFVERTQIMA